MCSETFYTITKPQTAWTLQNRQRLFVHLQHNTSHAGTLLTSLSPTLVLCPISSAARYKGSRPPLPRRHPVTPTLRRGHSRRHTGRRGASRAVTASARAAWRPIAPRRARDVTRAAIVPDAPRPAPQRPRRAVWGAFRQRGWRAGFVVFVSVWDAANGSRWAGRRGVWCEPVRRSFECRWQKVHQWADVLDLSAPIAPVTHRPRRRLDQFIMFCDHANVVSIQEAWIKSQ